MKQFHFHHFAIIILLLISFSACNRDPVKVGLLMHSFNAERWSVDKEYIVERVTELGGEVVFRLANEDQKKQNRQAKQLIEDGIDVLIVVPVDQNKSSEIINTARENDVKVIAYDRLIKDCLLDYYVTTNSVRVGEIQAEYMTKVVPKGKYAMIVGAEKDNNSLMLFLGQMNVLQEKVESGDVQVIYSEFTENWSTEEAYIHAKKVLSLKDSVDAFICGGDMLAYGVNTALEEAGLLGKVKVISQNAELKVLKSIVNGDQLATIYKPYREMGYLAAELAVKLARGNEIEKNYTTVSNGVRLVPSYQLEPMLVDKNTISSTVVAGGYLRSEEIYQ